MTKKQRREHKQGNQRRKAEHIRMAKSGLREDRSYYANMGHIQNGRFTK